MVSKTWATFWQETTYLSPIHIPLTQLIEVCFRKGLHVGLTLPRFIRLRRHLFHFTNMMLPNLFPCSRLQVLISNTHVDTALESFIKRLDTICGQEQDPLVVLGKSQEHRDERVTVDVVRLTRLKEDISFIKEQDCAP